VIVPKSFTTTSILCAALAGCASTSGAGSAASPSLSAAEQSAARRITAAEIEGPLRFLSDDLLEGRAPGTRGSQLAIRYLASELEASGLIGGALGPDGKRSFLQPVPLVKYTSTEPAELVIRAGAEQLSLRAAGEAPEVVVRSFADTERVHLESAELVFAGYGIVAPEHGWDDYRDKDVRGKIVVLLNFNPPFAGEGVRLWYGRWDYKYQEAARHGAAGALLIHTTESAGYPWSVVTSSQRGVGFSLPPEGEPRLPIQGWITEQAAARLFKLGGRDLAADARVAADPAGKGAPDLSLRATASLDLPLSREPLESANVLGLLPGTDEKLRDELVVFTAHHDHLGMKPAPPGKDGIYNGALDNASGCAALIAIARAAAQSPPKRSLLFLFVTAEEQGLLGSRWYARHPTVKPARIAADINVDSFNRFGRTSDLSMLGLGKSSLDAVVRAVAGAQGRSVHGDAFPDRGAFYRSDQFEFARIGVPVVAAQGGPTYVGRPQGWGREQHEEYERTHYHQPSDEYPPYPGGWDLSGAVEDAQLQLVVGLRIAGAPELPQWTPGDEFERARKESQ
jgi:Zn-dependent M28 family amino/carboxypeptidase